jgi:tripartite-type tricarboxylate transporter receptor subunit TctC
VGGQVQLAFVSIPTALSFIKQQRLRALGVTTAKRTALFPDLPTIAEAALPGYELPNWVGLLAPASTPPETVSRLNAEIARWMTQPDTPQKILALGVDAGGGTAASFAETIAHGQAVMGKTLQRAGFKVE